MEDNKRNIKITPKIMLDHGFTMRYDATEWFRKPDIVMDWSPISQEYNCRNRNNFKKPFKYVHELQWILYDLGCNS